MTGLDEIRETLRTVIEPPSPLPTWQWIEKYCKLPPTAPWQGKFDFELFPFSKIFLNWVDNVLTRTITVMKCAQSALTQTTVQAVLRRMKDRPSDTMWVMAKAESCEEFGKVRLRDSIDRCELVASMVPEKGITSRLVRADSMNVFLRGAESRIGLQSDPVGLIVCDERREWKKGRIEIVRKRTRAFARCLEISIGTAGNKNDELHQDFNKGSQGFPHFRCPRCDRSQPFRFGRDANTLFSNERERGGLVWEDTREAGKWNRKEFVKHVRFQCETCEQEFRTTDKPAMLATVHEFHRVPDALPEHPSLHCDAMMLPWASCSFEAMAWKFVEAMEAMKFGNIEMLMEVIEEDRGEPWELRSATNRDKEYLNRRGKFKLGQMWADEKDSSLLEPNTTLILTFDRQTFHLVYLIRQWRKNGESRLIECGTVPGYDDLRVLQQERKINNGCMWGDDGGKDTTNFRQTCLRYGWRILKGEDFEHYTIQGQTKDELGKETSHRQGWRHTKFDPGIGTISQGRATIDAWLFSNSWYLDKLYNMFLVGKGPVFEIPQDVPTAYMQEIGAYEWRERTSKQDGGTEGFWYTSGPNHFADCEKMQLVVADVGAITRFLPKPKDQRK
jgi:hypothetical protein